MKKKLCSALLALLLAFSLLPAGRAAANNDFSAMLAGHSLRDFADEEKGTLTILGSSYDLEHVVFLDFCRVGDELEVCICRTVENAEVVDPSYLPDGCTIELRKEPIEDIEVKNHLRDRGPVDKSAGEDYYLYLVGKPTREGNFIFYVGARNLPDSLYLCNIEVWPAEDDGGSTGPFAIFEPTTEQTLPPVSYNPPATEEPVYIAPATEEPVYVPPATEVPVYIPPATEAPVYVPPATEAPVYVPPSTQAPVYVPPSTQAPVYVPPSTQAPVYTQPLTPTVSITGDVRCRPGESVVLEARPDGTGLVLYQWYSSMGPYSAAIEGATDRYYRPDTSRVGVWSYFCMATFCTDSNSVTVQSEPMTLTVAEAAVTGVQILNPAAKTSYQVGERVDTSGLTLYVSYNDGSYRYVDTGYSVYPTSFDSDGSKTVWITYGGKSCSYSVTVRKAQTAATLRGIGVLTLPDKTAYRVGEWLEATGLTLRAYYTDGTTKDVYWGFVCSPEQLTRAGRQTVTVSYGGKTCSFEVTVEEDRRVTGIGIQTLPVNRSYTVGDRVNTTGLTLSVYTNRGTETAASGYTVSPQTLNTAGTQRITVSYEGQQTSFTVEVRERYTPTPTPTARPTPTPTAAGWPTPTPTAAGWPTPTPTAGVGLGAFGTPSPSPSPSAAPAPTAAPARRNTGVGTMVKVLFVVAVLALVGLIAVILILRRHSHDEEEEYEEPSPSERLHDFVERGRDDRNRRRK